MKFKERLANRLLVKGGRLLVRLYALGQPVGVYQISYGEDGKRSIKYQAKFVLPKRLVQGSTAIQPGGRESHSSKQEIIRQFNAEMEYRGQTDERYAKFTPLELHQFREIKIAQLCRASIRNRLQYFVLSCMAPEQVLTIN
jgi:hypothetical protein